MSLQLLLIDGPDGPIVHLPPREMMDAPTKYPETGEKTIEVHKLPVTGDLEKYLPTLDLIAENDVDGLNKLFDDMLNTAFNWGRKYEREHMKDTPP